MRKHTYTHELAPLNTGSVSRPARFNLRETCEVHARTHALFQAIREKTGMAKDADYADVWEKKILLAAEHLVWHLDNSPTSVKNFVRSLFEPLPREDYVRARLAELKARLEPKRVDADGNGKKKE